MKLVTYQKDGRCRLGAMLDDTKVIDLNLAYAEQLKHDGELTPTVVADALLPADMRRFLARGDRGLDLARTVIEWVKGHTGCKCCEGFVIGRDQVKLCAPIMNPPKIICLSHNYIDFIEQTGVPTPPAPRIFSKYHNTICGPEDDIIKPKATNELGYEAELAFVIGKPGYKIDEKDAYQHIAGYTIFNDVSASDITTLDKQVVRGKTYDTFAPIGPWIVTRDEVEDPHNLDIKCWVNDKLLQDSNTRYVLYQIPKLVSFLSDVFMLEPGDIVATGTPPGIAKFSPNPTYMHPGDVCRIEIDKLGVLANRIVAEAD
jgi:acylpyruvate hydrolase